MAQQDSKPQVKVEECLPVQEQVRRSTVKQTREMEMGVTTRKGEKPVIFKYTREDM